MVIRGRGGFYADGYVYAIATEREFKCEQYHHGAQPARGRQHDQSIALAMARGLAGDQSGPFPRWSSSFATATPILSYPSHITYPQMSYDSPLHRYLLTFSFSCSATPPAIWQDGAELVILDAPHPWGPFSFVAHSPEFGPSNGYSAGFPVDWISRNGRDLWLKWAANFDGCAAHLNCTGGYGFNYERMHLTLAGPRPKR